jgi:hypothetical protein
MQNIPTNLIGLLINKSEVLKKMDIRSAIVGYLICKPSSESPQFLRNKINAA